MARNLLSRLSVEFGSDLATVLSKVSCVINGVDGWLTERQAAVLSLLASTLSEGSTMVEIGTFHGRSAIALLSSVRDGVSLVCIDPFAGCNRGPSERDGKEVEADSDLIAFRANVESHSLGAQVDHIRLESRYAVKEFSGSPRLVFIDGSHKYGDAVDDLLSWGARLPVGGWLLVHDSFSSLGVSLALASWMRSNVQFIHVGREGSLLCYQKHEQDGRIRICESLWLLSRIPVLLWNLVVKLRLLAQGFWFGDEYRSSRWPY